MGCVSNVPSERVSINTNNSVQSLQSATSIKQNIIARSPSASESYVENPKVVNRRSINSNSFPLNSIDEHGQIPNYIAPTPTPTRTITPLTHETLREHTIQCEMGIDSSSNTTVSSGGDALRQIGDQLHSMNIKQTTHKSTENAK